jgi:4-amino-4-deoxy-L-arabinose transferase-like glycosyltransferase
MLTVYRALESRKWQDYVVSGVVLGATALVKGTPMLFPVWLFGYCLIANRKQPKWDICRHFAILTMAMFVTMTPWIIRNYSLTKRFIPTATVLGVSAHAGLYDNTHVSTEENWAVADRNGARERRRIALELGYPFKNVQNAYYQDFYSSEDEVKFSDYLLKGVIGEYKGSPALFLECVRSNLFNLWFRGKTRTATLLNVITQVPYLCLAFAGAVLCIVRKRIRAAAPLLLLLAYVICVYVAILAQARYSVPLMPFVSILASVSVAAARRKFEGKGRRAAEAVPAGV